MCIRCPNCKTSTRLKMGFDEFKARCGSCGRVWSLAALGELGATPSERSESALEFSEREGIDLASAYSVLLGLMSVDDAREWAKASAAGEGSGGTGAPQEDHVFQASALARKHGLPMGLAFDVAKGKLSLDVALRRKRDGRQSLVFSQGIHRRRDSSAGAWMAPVAAGLAVGFALLFAASQKQVVEPARTLRVPVAGDAASPPADALLPAVHIAEPSADPPPPATEATTDERGRITRLSGRTPISILQAFCEASSGRDRCEPVGIESTRPHRAGVRIGVLRKAEYPGLDFAIGIHRIRQDGTWFAGTGLKPLQADLLSR